LCSANGSGRTVPQYLPSCRSLALGMPAALFRLMALAPQQFNSLPAWTKRFSELRKVACFCCNAANSIRTRGTFSRCHCCTLMAGPQPRAPCVNRPMTRTKIQKRFLPAIAAVLVVVSVSHPADGRNAQRVPALVTRQFPDALGSANSSPVPQSTYLSSARSAPSAKVVSRSCDRFWCYEN
jgi:hypothetical protein